MFGAIIGDLAGSVYEFEQTKNHKIVEMKNVINENSFFSDDTFLTMAILNAALSHRDYSKSLKDFGLKYENYSPNFSPYFKTIFSPGFTRWLHSDEIGKSKGNGAMMRISPVGWIFNTKQEVEKQVLLATKPSHNSREAIYSAKVVALIIYYARKGFSKKEIISKLHLTISKPTITKFNLTCKDTLPLCLYSVFTANSFEESIKIALSFGGDTDTNACITASMAEAFYGISEDLKSRALQFLPNEFVSLLNKVSPKNIKQKHG